ncbi:protein PFF0380w-like isoform X2 [Myzus persicae]|uniref:protein PFF0380w-like isoform X2 n=1 Tax=Myzus persicae TaxID=13164 RepID=UPI000B932BFD|nr:protein PFF0380w-like isoform X2 [Myzus persicae]
MDERWQTFFDKFPETVTSEQLPVKLPRFDLDLCDLAGAAADWCHQYLKDRKCPSDLLVFLTQKIINNLRVQWAAEPKLFGYRPEKEDYQALWLMQKVIGELNNVCLNHATVIPYHQPISTPVWWSSFVLKNVRRQMEDYITVVPYLHTLFDVKDFGEASFYAVYDGHNGLDAAVYSSMYLHQFLVQSTQYPTNPEYALYEAFFATDRGFTQKTEKYNLVSGTTAVCALYRQQEKKLYVAWVGDSIATLWKNGTPLCLVNKHVPERYDESQRIENEGGIISKCQGIWRVDGQLAVSRAIGDVKYKPHITCKPEMRSLVLDGNEEFLVLSSDGFWEYMTPEEIAETIYDELLDTDGDISEVCNKLVFRSKAQGSKDNISVITVFLQDPKQLVAKRRAAIMETAMEPRNATETLASYGQDAGDFGPETDVDTPDEPIGLTKPKEGEASVIDESGEESEEDGGGWNYYKKPTEDTDKKTYQEDVNGTSNNSDAEDMDYKLNPDAPEFVPVSSPPPTTMNHAQRLLNTDNDDFISSSPQKFKDLDNVVVPDENDFTNEIKVHAADLSKLNNPYEPNDDSTMLNGIKPLNDEEVTNHGATDDNFILQNEYITNGNLDEYQNPFVSDDKVDLNKVQDLSEYQNDDAQTHITDPFVSVMESSKNNELNLTSGDNESQNESDVELNSDFSIVKQEEDMNSQNVDDTINTTNATAGSTLQFDEESFKHNDDFKNDFLDSSQMDKFSQYEDRKLNDSESTTDAILGSEPHTPMRMDNQSTFESENDDDQFSEAFKQQTQFNQFDENNDKENHDPFCFEQTEDPAGIIPNVTHVVNNEVDEMHHNIDNIIPNEHQVSELLKHEPVEEPLCIKEEAKPFHSVYEQQYLPESDFSASIHEALLNATENETSNHEVDDNNIDSFEPHAIVDSHVEIKNEYLEHQKVSENPCPEVVPVHIDDVKNHAQDLEQEFKHGNTYNFEYENHSVNSVQNENIEPEHYHVNDNYKLVEDVKHENFIQDHAEDLEIIKNTEHADVSKTIQENIEVQKENQYDVSAIQDSENVEQKYNNVADILSYDTEDPKQGDQLIAESVKNCMEDVSKTEQIPIEDFEQKYFNNVSEVQLNQVDNINQSLHNEEFENSNVEGFKQEHNNVDLFENNYAQDIKQHQSVSEVENFKQDQEIADEFLMKHHEDLQQENHGNESIQNHITDSDEEMHSSMIIHSDVENNMPQPYCSASDTLINESNMMCTSMTFEENFQNRNMSDSLYVMETSADYFGEEVQQTTQLDKPIDKPTVEEPSNIDDKLVEQVQNKNDIVTESNFDVVSEPKIENNAETTELIPNSQDCVENVDNQDDNNKIAKIAVAAAVGTAAIAAVTGVNLASKKSAPKKMETTVSKVKTTTPKTASTKPLASKTLAPTLKKTTSSTTASKPLSRPSTATSTSKPTTNVRPTTAPKTTFLKATAVTKAAPKPTPKTSIPASRPISAKTTPTTPRTTLTKTTPLSSPRTPTTPKTTTTASKSIGTSPKTNITPRMSLVNKQPLTNGSPKPLSRPMSAPIKKPLTSVSTNGTTKLTNGDVSKTSTTSKPPVTLASRMSLAPPKLPPKAKVAPKTVAPPAMPGPIRRPKAPITKKTETATS